MSEALDLALCGGILRSVTVKTAGVGPAPGGADMSGQFKHFHRANDAAAEAIRIQLANHYPAIAWADSEDKPELQNEAEHALYWICDPIDGAYHFLQGLPGWTSSLALIRNGVVEAAMVFDPFENVLYTAQADKGAWRNGEALHASTRTALDASVVATSFPSRPGRDRLDTERLLAGVAKVAPQVFSVRMLGSSSLQLCHVAAGRLDGHFEYGHDLYDWLAGTLIAREAGALVTAIDGSGFGWGSYGVMAAAPALHKPLLSLAGSPLS